MICLSNINSGCFLRSFSFIASGKLVGIELQPASYLKHADNVRLMGFVVSSPAMSKGRRILCSTESSSIKLNA